MDRIKIGNLYVGDGERCFIVFEAGPTIDSLETGKRLCDAASEAGADAIKFQIMDVDRLMGEKDVKFTYGTAKGDVTERLYDILKRRELSYDEWAELKKHCDSLGLLFFSTALFPEEIVFLKKIGSCAIKIAAADINHLYLIEYAARSGLPVILDARGTRQELDDAVEICKNSGNDNMMIMHCPPGYPCKDSEVNLAALDYIKKRYACPVGFSDHSVQDLMDYACIGFGANCIEKTITLDKSTRSAEHYMSLEPDEMKNFVLNIRKIESAVGDVGNIFISAPNLGARRSLAAMKDLKKGHRLTLDDIDFKRPGNYIPVDRFKRYIGRTLKEDIKKDGFFKEEMFEKDV